MHLYMIMIDIKRKKARLRDEQTTRTKPSQMKVNLYKLIISQKTNLNKI
jgi:hypothetical protein